ncbi:MAG TPA: mechanosensitive ion channel family protein [Candidatus Limnocylindria bacterium]|nr:mechanosensitive ion channel family protein [Candidatus Limnocylindria bacterium]
MKMRNSFVALFRSLGLLLFFCLVWAVWAQTQPATNAPARPAPEVQAASVKATQTTVWLTFGLDRVPFLQSRSLADIPLWQYLASLIYVFLAFYISKFLDHVIRHRVRKWAEKTRTKVDDLFVELVRGPVKIVTFVILLHIGMEVYAWPESLARFFSNALKIIVACSLTYVLLKAIDLLMGVWHQRATTPENEQFSKQLLPLLRKTFKVFVVIIATLVTSQNLGFNVTGLIASLSIGGLAIGLAAQDTLGNLFGAVAILTDKPFRVGDRIQLDNVDGTVENIGFRSTAVRNLNGHLVSVPNKTMGNATITNVSQRPNIKTEMNIGITYDTPAERVARAMQILEEVFKPHPMTADLIISFNKFESSSLNILVVHWWNSTDFKAYLAGIQLLNLEVKRRFDAEGISFAFPTQTLYLKQDSDWRLGGPTAIENAGQR